MRKIAQCSHKVKLWIPWEVNLILYTPKIKQNAKNFFLMAINLQERQFKFNGYKYIAKTVKYTKNCSKMPQTVKIWSVFGHKNIQKAYIKKKNQWIFVIKSLIFTWATCNGIIGVKNLLMQPKGKKMLKLVFQPGFRHP